MISLLGIYRPRNTPLHKSSAGFKLMLLLVAAVFVIVVDDPVTACGVAAASLLLLLSTIPPAKATLRGLAFIFLMAAVTVIFQVWRQEYAKAIDTAADKLRHLLKGPDRPNNVDVEYGIDLDASPTDIAVLTERLGRRLRVYAIARDGSALRDISAGKMPILDGASGDEGAPMGIALYRRPKDGAIFAIVAPKAGP